MQRSKELDKLFGYRISRIEQKLTKKYRTFDKRADATNRKKHFGGSQVWIGLNPQTLQTPYIDLYWILSVLQSYDLNRVVDLGAGYGRVGLVTKMVYPGASFVGIEILKERCVEACRVFNKLGLSNCEMLNENIVDRDFAMPEADLYFIYDFSHSDEINFALNQMCKMNRARLYFLVAAVGETVNFLIGRSGAGFHGKWKLIDSRNGIRIFCVTRSSFGE